MTRQIPLTLTTPAEPGTDLYRRMLGAYEGRDLDLFHRVWDDTPWMVDAYAGSPDSDRRRTMVEWCDDRFGPEAWPIHGRAGDWRLGGVTMNGWTWIGFKTEQQLLEFCAAWPEPEQPE